MDACGTLMNIGEVTDLLRVIDSWVELRYGYAGEDENKLMYSDCQDVLDVAFV